MIHRIGFADNENLDDVKATVSPFHTVLLHIQEGRAKNTMPLSIPYSLCGDAEARRMARLDLDEEQCAIFLSNDVDLTRLHTKLPFQYAAATLFQIQRRRFLASVAKPLRRHRGSSGF